jgi:hypothetical protein
MNTLHQAAIGLLIFSLTISFEKSLADGEVSLVGTRDAIQSLTNRRIFFGHQSVGGNIVEGLEDIFNIESISAPSIININGKVIPNVGSGFYHGYLGNNGSPDTKNVAFARVIIESSGKLDVAFFKYCYLDIDASTDVKKVFEQYRSMMSKLRLKYPKIKFIHVTDPLTTVQTGTKAWIKRLLGKPLGGYDANRKPNEYNEYVRKQYYGKEPIFDLAEIESQLPDGSHVTYDYEGKCYPALAQMYTDDGSHLNEAGKRRVAEKLIGFLSTLVLKQTASY